MNRKSCKDCYYHRTIYGGTDSNKICHYMLDTGDIRNSDPNHCDKYRKLIKSKSWGVKQCT